MDFSQPWYYLSYHDDLKGEKVLAVARVEATVLAGLFLELDVAL